MASKQYQQLEFEITHRYEKVQIEESTFEDLINAATWKRTPRFIKRGRSSREVLQQPAFLENKPDEKLLFGKLKGVGVFDPESQGKYRDKILDQYSDEPQPPTTKPLTSFVSYPHVGFTKEGQFAMVLGSLAPVGGILLDRAVLEYENARILVENGVSTIVPLVVIRYKNLEFEGKPMGAVITLSPEPSPYRISEVQYLASCQPGKDLEADDYFKRVMQSLLDQEQDLDFYDEKVRLKAVNLLSKKIGQSLNRFSKAGLYRYSSEWSNFEYCFTNKEPVFTDLDSTLELKDIPSPELRTLQVIRDLSTVVYRLVSKFGTPSALKVYTLENLLKYDPLIETLEGYFQEIWDEEKENLKKISKMLWNAYIPYLFLLKKHQDPINSGEWNSERRRSYKMDHDLYYVLTIVALFPIFKKTALFKMYPCCISQETLMDRAKVFLKERYEYFVYLLNQQ